MKWGNVPSEGVTHQLTNSSAYQSIEFPPISPFPKDFLEATSAHDPFVVKFNQYHNTGSSCVCVLLNVTIHKIYTMVPAILGFQ